MLSNKQIIEYIDVVKKSDLNGISELVHSWALDDDETKQITLKTKYLIKEIQFLRRQVLIGSLTFHALALDRGIRT